MPLHIWIAFVAASAVLLVIPGPTVLLVVGDALANGRRKAWSTVFGVGCGDAMAMGLSLAGAGALLRASAAAFAVMKLLGGTYLIYLGIRSIAGARQGNGSLEARAARANSGLPPGPAQRFTKAWAVTVLNPKSILFFVAFLPQFISAHTSFVSQAAILMVTFVSMAMTNASMYSSLAGLLGEKLTLPATQRRTGYAGGGILIAAGTLTLTSSRS